jgi:hypothetical protein
MRNCLAFLLILFALSGFAQDEIQWFQPGQEWYYRVFCLQSIDCGYVHYSVEGTEVRGGEEAAVLIRSEVQEGWDSVYVRTEYLRYDTDTVWRYSELSEQWHMLYDFGAQPGDVWTIQDEIDHGYDLLYDESPETYLFEVIVDSVAFWSEVPGSTLENRRVVYTSPMSGPGNASSFSFGLFTAPIIEGIGPVGSAKDLIGNDNFVILPTYEARFQCFLDNGALAYGEAGSPCFILNTNEFNQVDHGLIYPNPATETIFWDEPIDALQIFDAQGKLVLQNAQTHSLASLSVAELETGFYTVVISRNQKSFSQKLMIR